MVKRRDIPSTLTVEEIKRRYNLESEESVEIDTTTLLDKVTYDPNCDGVINFEQGGTGETTRENALFALLSDSVIPNLNLDIDTDISTFTGEADTQQYINIGEVLIIFGRRLITPVANTATGKTVTFVKEFSEPPFVITGVNTTVTGTTIKGTSATSITNNSMDVYVYRTNTTGTSVYWLAIGRKSI